ncbi:TPA: hypothetical protein N0F65_003767, partial [Lagenidium giganteum]
LDFQIDSRDGTTDTTFAAFIGTLSLNALKLGVNDSTKMTISASTGTVGYVGIGTSSPTTPLTVSGSTSRTFDVGGLGYSNLAKSGVVTSIGPVTTTICGTFSDSLLITTGSYYTTSDRRIKKKY